MTKRDTPDSSQRHHLQLGTLAPASALLATTDDVTSPHDDRWTGDQSRTPYKRVVVAPADRIGAARIIPLRVSGDRPRSRR
jgi:hypothetical protein